MGIVSRSTSPQNFLFTKDESGEHLVPKAVIHLMDNTRELYRLWWCAHYTFGLIGVIAGILLTALTSPGVNVERLPEFLSNSSWVIGISAAVSTGLITFLGPLHKAERYWSAYHYLEQACLEYHGSDGDPRIRKQKLMKRVREARKILQAVDVDQSTISLPDEPKPPPE